MDQANLLNNEEEAERVVLVGVHTRAQAEWEAQDTLEELQRLTHTAGGDVVASMLFRRDVPHPGYYIGTGKAEEVSHRVKETKAHTVIFDDELSPAQGRNLEKLLGVKVIDRTQLILHIFGKHARTREGRLQVELARLDYTLPRLRRMWTHLERQKGGIGMRGGMGEQQIEIDRRLVREDMRKIRVELKHVSKTRGEQRRGRRRHGWSLVSIIGYTNAGKSTMLNTLTGASIQADDALFVTLDPTTRKVELPHHQPVLVTDTVGFIQKLPHGLIDSFKATLEEVEEADLLLHVIDASHERAMQQIEAVESVLRELKCEDKPVLAVFNKMDREAAVAQSKGLARHFEHSVCISARENSGTDELLTTIADMLRNKLKSVCLHLPFSQSKKLAEIRAAGAIQEEFFDAEGACLRARVPGPMLSGLKKWQLSDEAYRARKEQQQA